MSSMEIPVMATVIMEFAVANPLGSKPECPQGERGALVKD